MRVAPERGGVAMDCVRRRFQSHVPSYQHSSNVVTWLMGRNTGLSAGKQSGTSPPARGVIVVLHSMVSLLDQEVLLL